MYKNYKHEGEKMLKNYNTYLVLFLPLHNARTDWYLSSFFFHVSFSIEGSKEKLKACFWFLKNSKRKPIMSELYLSEFPQGRAKLRE